MRSWNGYGGKNGTNPKTPLRVLGCQRPRPSLRRAVRHSAGAHSLPTVRCGRLVGDAGGDCQRPGAAGTHETPQLRRMGHIAATGNGSGRPMGGHPAFRRFARPGHAVSESIRFTCCRRATARGRARMVRRSSAGPGFHRSRSKIAGGRATFRIRSRAALAGTSEYFRPMPLPHLPRPL